MIKKENIKLINIEFIQEFLPDGHPDKIVKSKHTFTYNNFTYEEDKIYLYDDHILVRFKKERENLNNTLFIRNKNYTVAKSWVFNIKDVRLANQEEIEWFELCEKEGKYLPKPEKQVEVKMTKEQILEKAKRDYPVGTVFKQVDNGIKAVIDERSFTNKPDEYWLNENCLIIYYSRLEGDKVTGAGCYLFKDGKWAEIISKPEVKVEEKWIPQIGDWIIVIHQPNGGINSKTYDGKCLQITEISNSNSYVCTKEIPNGLWYKDMRYKQEFRKALPNEIPTMKEINLVGRYVKSLRGNTNYDIKSGEYLLIKKDNSSTIELEKYGIASHPVNSNSSFVQYWELMPIGFTPEIKSEVKSNNFVLPEKWCVRRVGKKNSELINNYFNKGLNTNNAYITLDDSWYLHFPNYQDNTEFKYGCHSGSTLKEGYTEITFEQFKTHVLKENTNSGISVNTAIIHWSEYGPKYTFGIDPYEKTSLIKPITNKIEVKIKKVNSQPIKKEKKQLIIKTINKLKLN